MMKFREYMQTYADDSIEQVMDGEWIQKSRTTWKATDDNDNQIEEVWKQQYPLAEFTAASNFKSYEELKTRLDTVLSGTVTVGNIAEKMEDEPVMAPMVDTTPVDDTPPFKVDSSEDDDTMDYFAKLAS